jgi:fibro-slime domain-containing protein
MAGNNEVGYYPGSNMTPEGGGWFYYTYKTFSKNSNTSFKIVDWIGPDSWYGTVQYHGTFYTDSLFSPFSSTTEELWIVLQDTIAKPRIYDKPPGGKVINIFNPWPDNSPQIIIGGSPPAKMRPREEICGWYRYYFAGPPDSLGTVKFTDYFHSQTYTSSGLTNGTPIDLRNFFKTKDTVYILPRPFPFGIPSITSTFPGRTGDCGFRKISGVFRDWKQDDISFFNNPTGMNGGGSKGMVEPVLPGPDFKPLKTLDPSANVTHATQLNTWFKTIKFPDGTNNDTCMDLVMRKSEDGQWEFNSDWMGGFFPIDSFNNPNNIKYADASKKMHNFHFTMEMHMQFIYHKNAGLKFYFRGDDDVWIYVNNRLAIDLGGLHENASDSLDLDKSSATLGIVDGKTYNMDIFFAERNPVGSNFRIKTSMDLRNNNELYYKDALVSKGKIQYDIWQKVQQNGNDCGVTLILNEEERARVDFFINGPQFPQGTSVKLDPGTHYGGITVDTSRSRVTLDSALIDGLASGDYTIMFQSTTNKDRNGYLAFTVPPKPDHLDIITDPTMLDFSKDASVDTLFIDMDQDSTWIYSVIRDLSGKYISNSKNPIWTSRNEKVITVQPSPSDPSRCLITKVNGGTTWIIVNENGLKPDSVKVTAIAKPKWPLISSALMLDDDGNLIPDLVIITLSDTFKTGQLLTQVDLSYKGNKYTVSGPDCKIDGKTISVPFVSSGGIDTKPSGNATINLNVEGETAQHTKAFSDGVGPGIIGADVLENDGTDPDILFLTFSEPVVSSSLKGKQLLLIRNGSADTLPLEILQIVKVINDSTFSLKVSSSDIRPGADMVRLLPGNQGGTITELNDIKAHVRNPSVVAGSKKGAALISRANYQDINADGIIDRVIVHMKRKVDLSEFSTITVQWNSQLFKVSTDSVRSVSDSVISIGISRTVTEASTCVTSGNMYLSIVYSSAPSTKRTSAVADSAAPVLISARLFPGEFLDDGSRKSDTLEVTFSEPVKTPGSSPFLLYTKKSELRYQFSVTLLNVNSQHSVFKFLINKTDPENVVYAKGDSVWINNNSPVIDTIGVAQTNPLNRRVLLDLIQPPPEWTTLIGPNPMTSSTGINILVSPKRKVILSPFSAELKIYDGVGNVVKNYPLQTAQVNGFKFNWDGSNTIGRLCGTGTYLAVLKVRENNKEIWIDRKSIGVLRK